MIDDEFNLFLICMIECFVEYLFIGWVVFFFDILLLFLDIV